MKKSKIENILLSFRQDNCIFCGKTISHDNTHMPDYCTEKCYRKHRRKNWPIEEDCPGCPAHINGPHKMSCSVTKSQIKLYINLKEK